MEHLIGKKLEDVLEVLNKSGYSVQIKDNNHNVNGDTLLVTNIVANDKTVIVTVGSFIFDVRNKVTNRLTTTPPSTSSGDSMKSWAFRW